MARGTTSISGGQLVILLLTLVGSTAILYAPAMSIPEAGQNAWLSLLLPATLYGLVVVWVTTKLARRFPRLTFGQYVEVILGSWLSRLVGFLYLLFILIWLVIIVREHGNFLSNAFMAETPMLVFHISLLLLASFTAVEGIEVICRMNQFLLPLLVVAMTFMVVLLLKDIELVRLLPLLDEGWGPVLKGAFLPGMFRGEVFVLMWLVYHLDRPEQSTKWGSWAVLLLALVLVVDVVIILGVMGKELASRDIFPTLMVARYANWGALISRTEGILMMIWIAGIVIKASMLLYIGAEVARETFSFRGSSWYLIIPMAVLLSVGAVYFFKNDFQLIWFIKHIFPPMALVFQLVLPSLMLLIAWVRQKGARDLG